MKLSEEEKKKREASRRKKYYLKNKERILFRTKEYRKNKMATDRDYLLKIRLRNKEFRDANKDKIKEKRRIRVKNRYYADPYYKALHLAKTLFYKIVTRKNVKSAKDLIGCSSQEVRDFISSKLKPEMTWDNYGKIWEIDHIKPFTSFNILDPDQKKQCFHYTNLQPLFKTTEIAKSFGYENEIGNLDKAKPENKYLNQ